MLLWVWAWTKTLFRTPKSKKPALRRRVSRALLGTVHGNGRATPGLDPTDRFRRQRVERLHGHLEMLFLRVLDFVVGNAVEALDEHHDGGDAGPGDFGGVVEGAGGEAMWVGAGFANGFVAEGDEIVVKQNRFDLPKAFPRNGDISFLGETFAGFFRFSEHAG